MRGARRTRVGTQQRRCRRGRRARFRPRRMAGVRQPPGRVRHRRRQGGKVPVAAADRGQPRAVDEFDRRLRRRPTPGGARECDVGRRQRPRTGMACRHRSLDRRRHAGGPGPARETDRAMAARPARGESRAAPCAWPRRRRRNPAHRRADRVGQRRQPLCLGDAGLRPRRVQPPRRGRGRGTQGDRARPPRSVGASRRRPLPGIARAASGRRGLPDIDVGHVGELQLLHVHPSLVAPGALPDRPRPHRRGAPALRQARVGRVEGVLRGPDQRRLAAGASRTARRR